MTTPIDPRGGFTSASNAPADARCAGRHQACKGLPDIETEDSSFGTQIHDALRDENPEGLSSDQLSIYESCVEIREKQIQDKFGLDTPKVVRIKEQRFWWASSDGTLKHSGQVDLIAHLPDGLEALIIDYKTLPGEVESAETNEQLRDEVALTAGNLKFTEVDVVPIQPLVTHSPTPCRYDMPAIARSQADMVARVKASNSPLAKRTAGVLQCKYCKARFTCKEHAEWQSINVPAAMSSLTVPVQTWSPEQRALFCERLPIAMRWLEECKAEIKRLLKENPKAVPGWKIGKGKTQTPITNPNELHTRFVEAGGTSQQFMECVDVAKGKFEAALRAATKLKGKGLLAKKEEILAGVTESKEGEGSLEVIK